MDVLRLFQKLSPYFRNNGKVINKNNDGNTNQKIWYESSAILMDGVPSICNQIKANTEVNGKDATKAAKMVERLAISDIATMKSADIMIFSI